METLLKVNPAQRKVLAIATVLALLVGAWFLKHYIMLVLLAALVVILFNPVYQWLLSHGRKPNTAALYTLSIAVLAVIIPLTVVILITVFQVERLVDTISSGTYPHDINSLVSDIVNWVNGLLADIGVSYRLSISTLTQAVSTAAQNFSKALLSGLVSTVGSFFSLITTAIIFIYVFMSMIVHQEKILNTLQKLNPLGNKVNTLYFDRINAMTKATVRGQFIIAFCQGTWSAVVLALVGLDNLFFFFWILLTVLSIVPLGAGIVTIPIGIAMILTGNVWQGAVVILNHLIIVTNIDNVLRPKLVPRQARLDPALMILAVFAGLGLFGFFGIVLGPVLMIVIVTTLQMYLEVFSGTKSIERASDGGKKNNMVSKLKFWNRD